MFQRSITILCTLLPIAAALASGCSKDDTTRQSRKGEACQVTNDCAGGLSCVPRPSGTAGGVCVTGDFQVAPTAKECAIIQCSMPVDCCPTPPSNCASLKSQCDLGGASSASYCAQYKAQCLCDGSAYACTAGACIAQAPACKLDADCGSNACVSGKCVECKTNDQCGGGSTCVSGACVKGCTLDSECPAFNRCASGQCVEGSCKSDRECVAATGSVEAKCNTTTTKCTVPCQTDLECGSSQDYNFYSCIAHECIYTGCDSDKMCELYYQRSNVSTGTGGGTGGTGGGTGGTGGGTGGTGDTGGGGTGSTNRAKIVCRDKVATATN